VQTYINDRIGDVDLGLILAEQRLIVDFSSVELEELFSPLRVDRDSSTFDELPRNLAILD